jgi:hypothetical protein
MSIFEGLASIKSKTQGIQEEKRSYNKKMLKTPGQTPNSEG